MKKKKLLIIISACNEAASLKIFLPRLRAEAALLPVTTYILIISDGSTDGTAKVASENQCLIVENKRNIGIGASLRIGYKRAIEEDYDFIVTMDADGQHSEKILRDTLFPVLYKKANIVIASRYNKGSERIGVPLDRDMLNISTLAQIKVVTNWSITDPLSGFWCMDRKCFEFVFKNSKQNRYGFHLENLIKFWYLFEPRPMLIEVPHPAIYKDNEIIKLLTRDYSDANQEQRVQRFGVHALNILEAIEDVREIKGANVIDEEIERRMKVFRS